MEFTAQKHSKQLVARLTASLTEDTPNLTGTAAAYVAPRRVPSPGRQLFGA